MLAKRAPSRLVILNGSMIYERLTSSGACSRSGSPEMPRPSVLAKACGWHPLRKQPDWQHPGAKSGSLLGLPSF